MHTDHLGDHPQIKNLQKGTFAHWFLNTYVLVVNKATQIGVLKKSNHRRSDLKK